MWFLHKQQNIEITVNQRVNNIFKVHLNKQKVNNPPAFMTNFWSVWIMRNDKISMTSNCRGNPRVMKSAVLSAPLLPLISPTMLTLYSWPAARPICVKEVGVPSTCTVICCSLSFCWVQTENKTSGICSCSHHGWGTGKPVRPVSTIISALFWQKVLSFIGFELLF